MNCPKKIVIDLLAFALITLVANPTANCSSPKQGVQTRTQQSQQPTTSQGAVTRTDSRTEEEKIEEREESRKGITVDRPKVYDDALLQQMLQAAEARLATLQLFDQSGLLARLGALTGASQQISSIGFNAQGLPLPQITTTNKGATGSTVQTTAAGATNSSFTINSGSPSQDVTTVMPQFGPPTVTAPVPTTSLPTSFSVSASDLLNEQAQLTAEISALRLLIRGSLSDHFVKADSEINTTKKKITLGFPVTILPDRRYKNAIAVVEVEVARDVNEEEVKRQVRADIEEEYPGQPKAFVEAEISKEVNETIRRRSSVDPPAVTTLLPREKTYNVAAITDKNVSIGGGVATQLLGFSGSWLRGHKTYYVVQDQDTIALTFSTTDSQGAGFMWQFRPVLGEEYVKSGLKQPFVQLSFAALEGADTVGSVTVRTYWRKYDRKRGIVQGIIAGSYHEQYVNAPVRTFFLAKRPMAFNSLGNVEDLGGGQVLVKIEGRYLPGTYVRIGSNALTPGPQLTHEYEEIRFIASLSDLITKRARLVATDGTETKPLEFGEKCGAQNEPLLISKDDKGKFKVTVEPSDDSNSRVTVEVNEPNQETRATPRLIVIGSRVFGFSDSPIKRDGTKLSADGVPSSLLKTKPDVRVQTLFPSKSCISNSVAAPGPVNAEKLTVLERGVTSTRFLLNGTRLKGIHVLSPSGVQLQNVGTADPDKLLYLVLGAAALRSNKQVLMQRYGEPPFLVNIPDLDAKKPEPPKAKERVTVGADEAVIDGDGLDDLVKVTFKKLEIISKDISADGKSVRLSGLRTLGVTSFAASQPLVLEFKSGAKATVMLEIVNSKVETVAR